MIKSFRGLLKDEGIDRIYLGTNTGRVGYRIIKFEVIPNNPGGQDPEAILNIFKRKPSSAVALIDFSDNDLVAAAYYSGGSTTLTGAGGAGDETVSTYLDLSSATNICSSYFCLSDSDTFGACRYSFPCHPL